MSGKARQGISTDHREDLNTADKLIRVVSIGTFLWVGGVIGFCWSNDIWSLRPNEVGDFVAGGSALLGAFLLFAAVAIQRMEVSNQLREFKKSVEQIERQADAATADVALVQHSEHMVALWNQISNLFVDFQSVGLVRDADICSAFGSGDAITRRIAVRDFFHAADEFCNKLENIGVAAKSEERQSVYAPHSSIVDLAQRLEVIKLGVRKAKDQKRKISSEFSVLLADAKLDEIEEALNLTIDALCKVADEDCTCGVDTNRPSGGSADEVFGNPDSLVRSQ